MKTTDQNLSIAVGSADFPDNTTPKPPGCNHPRRYLKPEFTAPDYISGHKFVVGYCYKCRLAVTTPVPSGDDLAAYYPKAYYGTGQRFTPVVEMLLDRLYTFRASSILEDRGPGRVLDIGCGRGLLLNKLRELGWDPHGTELSADAAAYARDRLNLPVTLGSLEDAGFSDGEFDLVVLWHVLEHVPDPRGTLREISRILKPGGRLLLAVPNFGSLEAKWTKWGWFHLDVPRHLTHFTHSALREALEDAGLAPARISYFSPEYDFFSFVQSAQNKFGLRHNLLYNLLRTRSARVLDESGRASDAGLIQVLLALLTSVPLSCISLVYVPMVALLRRGGTMMVMADKLDV